MTTRPFYLLACVLALAAGIVSAISKMDATQAATAAARAAPSSTPDRQSLQSISHTFAQQSDRLSVVAVVVFTVAVGLWICSLRRQEQGLQSIPLLLLLFAGILQLLFV